MDTSMTTAGVAGLETLLDDYIRLEKKIQALIAKVTGAYCRQCLGKCCKKEICREAIDSAFLALLVARQKVRFSDGSGWLGPRGCRLDYGRPLVCYDYFCQDILKSPMLQLSGLQDIIKAFLAAGNRARSSIHLICLQDPDRLPLKKIEMISKKIEDLSERIG